LVFISQKTTFFIVTVVETSHLTNSYLLSSAYVIFTDAVSIIRGQRASVTGIARHAATARSFCPSPSCSEVSAKQLAAAWRLVRVTSGSHACHFRRDVPHSPNSCGLYRRSYVKQELDENRQTAHSCRHIATRMNEGGSVVFVASPLTPWLC
jgi:hypothetical protein